MRLGEIYSKISNVIDEEIEKAFPHEWDENYITNRIVRKIRNNLNSIELLTKNKKQFIRIRALKLKGKPETHFGDLGMLFKIDYPDGDVLEGVAFLEAKKRYTKSGKFDAINFAQLQRIFLNFPYSKLLLYDFKKIKYLLPPYHPHIQFSSTVPTGIVCQTQKKDTSLYKFSMPFALQICARYFFGFDLEFKKEQIEIIKGYRPDMGAPKYLLTFSISSSERSNEYIFNLNRKIYKDLEED